MGTSHLLADDYEGSAVLFDGLLFQRLRRIELINPLRLPNQSPGIVGGSLLADGMVLHFDESAMVCTLPRQDSPCQHGTTLCLSEDGERQSLGYRLTVLDSEDADPLFLSRLHRRTILARDWISGGGEHAPMLLLAEAKREDRLWAISMRFLNGHRYRLLRRPELRCIEFSPEASTHGIAW